MTSREEQQNVTRCSLRVNEVPADTAEPTGVIQFTPLEREPIQTAPGQ